MTAGTEARLAFGPALVLLVGTALLAGSGCRVVPDAEPAQGGGAASSTDSQRFDAVAYAASVWDVKVLPHFGSKAVDLGPVLEALKQGPDQAGERYGRRADIEGSPWSFAVKGKGRVVSVDTESRAGVVVVAVDAPSGPQQVTLQIGPVVRGTAIRDCLPFFSFGSVTNQIQFAQVSRALNDRAVKGVQPSVAAVRAPGTLVEFTGAMNVGSPDDPLLITPLMLLRAGGT